MPPDCDVLLGPEYSLFELQLDIFAQVGATLCAAAAPRAPAKEISETKKVSEDVAEILEDGRVKTRRGASRAAHTRVAEAVIKGALLSVRENRIRLACFLELLLRVRVIGITIGMELQRELPVCALDFLLAGPPRHAEHFVIIAFYVTGQNKVSPMRMSMNLSVSDSGFALLSPSQDAAAGPSTYTRAAVPREPCGLRPRGSPPSRQPHGDADRTSLPEL